MYNLSAETTCTIKLIADDISETAARLAKTEKGYIIFQSHNELPLSVELNRKLFFEHFNWNPRHTISSIVESLTAF